MTPHPPQPPTATRNILQWAAGVGAILGATSVPFPYSFAKEKRLPPTNALRLKSMAACTSTPWAGCTSCNTIAWTGTGLLLRTTDGTASTTNVGATVVSTSTSYRDNHNSNTWAAVPATNMQPFSVADLSTGTGEPWLTITRPNGSQLFRGQTTRANDGTSGASVVFDDLGTYTALLEWRVHLEPLGLCVIEEHPHHHAGLVTTVPETHTWSITVTGNTALVVPPRPPPVPAPPTVPPPSPPPPSPSPPPPSPPPPSPPPPSPSPPPPSYPPAIPSDQPQAPPPPPSEPPSPSPPSPSPSPPPPPPPPSPPPPSPAPYAPEPVGMMTRQQHRVVISLAASESLEELTPDRREIVATALANEARVPRANVISLEVSAGSIVLNATLRAANASDAAASAALLSTAFATPAAASNLLNLTVTSAVSVEPLVLRTLVPVPSPPPVPSTPPLPPAPPPPPPTYLAASCASGGGTRRGRALGHPGACPPPPPPEASVDAVLAVASGIVLAVGLVVAILCCVLCRWRRREEATMTRSVGAVTAPSVESPALSSVIVRGKAAPATAATTAAGGGPSAAKPPPAQPVRTVFLFVDGMSCEHCVSPVHSALDVTLSAVARGDPTQESGIDVSLADGAVKIDLAPAAANVKPSALVAAVERTGKSAVVAIAYRVGGMTCEHCVSAVSDALGALTEVGRVHVTLQWGGMALVLPSEAANPAAAALTATLLQCVEAIGKSARPYDVSMPMTPYASSAPVGGDEMPARMKRALAKGGAPASAPPTVVPQSVVPPVSLGPKTHLRVSGMRCNGCAEQVQSALSGVDGVSSASVDLVEGTAVVWRGGDMAAESGGQKAAAAWIESLSSAVAATGRTAEYVSTGLAVAALGRINANASQPAPSPLPSSRTLSPPAINGADDKVAISPSVVTVDLVVNGMTCSACEGAVNDALLSVVGVHSASVAVLAHAAKVRFDPSVCTAAALVGAIHTRGYSASIKDWSDSSADDISAAHTRDARVWGCLFLFCLTFTLPILTISMILPMLGVRSAALAGDVADGLSVQTLVLFVLTTPVQIVGGYRFYIGAWKALRHCSTNMDVLVSLGSLSAYLYSVIFLLGNLFSGGRVLLYTLPMFMGCGELTTPSSIAYRASAMEMHRQMAFELTCDANVDFARGMLAHHRGALDACDMFIREAGARADPAMLHFCLAHVGPAQTWEVDLLTAWVNGRGLSPVARICEDVTQMGCGDLSCEASARTVAANMRMHHDMAIDFSGDPSVDFARTMIPHHEGAITMCDILRDFGDDPEMLALCDRIVAAQTMEVGEITTWLHLNGHRSVALCGADLPSRGCAVQPPERWGCGATGCASTTALVAMGERLHTALDVKYGCAQEADTARALASIQAAIVDSCAAVADVYSSVRPLWTPEESTFADVCANLTAAAPSRIAVLERLAVTHGRRRLGHSADAIGSPAGGVCDANITIGEATNQVRYLFLEANTPFAGPPAQRRPDGGYVSMGCGDLLCPSNVRLTNLNAATLSELSLQYTCNPVLDAGRALLVLFDDLHARCELLSSALNGGLPALSQSINQPLLSPGPYELQDAELAASCGVMSAEMLELRGGLREAVRAQGEAHAANGTTDGGRQLGNTATVVPPHPPQPPSPPPTPNTPTGLALEQAAAAALLEPRCPTPQCDLQTTFRGCGAIDGCNSSGLLLDGVRTATRPLALQHVCEPSVDFARLMSRMLDGAATICRSLSPGFSLDAAVVEECTAREVAASSTGLALRQWLSVHTSQAGSLCENPNDASGCTPAGTCRSSVAYHDVVARLHRRLAIDYTCEPSTDLGRLLRRQLQAHTYLCDALRTNDDTSRAGNEALAAACESATAEQAAAEARLSRYGLSAECADVTVGSHRHGSKLGMGHTDDEEVFETAAMLITFILLGKMLESIAKGRTSRAISKLLRLQPPSALRIAGCWEGANEEEEVPLDALRERDVVKVLPGAQVPADGVVLRGKSVVDEAVLTGESLPVPKTADDSVVGGTMNGPGVIYVLVLATGQSTVLATITRIVAEAQHRKVAVQQVADRISRIFVPTVVVLSISTYLTWAVCAHYGVVPLSMLTDAGVREPQLIAFVFGCAVLVVACPCALGLATPTAVMVGCSVGASHGILIKGGDVLEKAARTTDIFFDKTGTLTTGQLSVQEVCLVTKKDGDASDKPLGDLTNVELLRLAASAEAGSQHPIAKAVVVSYDAVAAKTESTRTRSEAQHSDETPGEGIRCVVDGRRVLVGNRSWLAEHGLALRSHEDDKAIAFEERGCTAVFVATDAFGPKLPAAETEEPQWPDQSGRVAGSDSRALLVAGIIAVSDTLKPEAHAVVAALERGYGKVWMLSGDNERTAKHVAGLAGIAPERVIAGVKPEGKAEHVKARQAEGSAVTMVGDGINDAPALATADVGIAIGGGTDVAFETADMVLMRPELYSVVTALHLSRRALNRIKINFAWAFVYNCVGIPFAAGVFYPTFGLHLPPMFAGIAMTASSISVVCSSLLLYCYRPPKVARVRSKQMRVSRTSPASGATTSSQAV